MSSLNFFPKHRVIQEYINRSISKVARDELEGTRLSSKQVNRMLEIIDLLMEHVVDSKFQVDEHLSPLTLQELDQKILNLFSGSIDTEESKSVLSNLYSSPISLDKLWIKSSQLAIMDEVPIPIAQSKTVTERPTDISPIPSSTFNWRWLMIPAAAIALGLFLYIPNNPNNIFSINNSNQYPEEYFFAKSVPFDFEKNGFLSTGNQTFDSLFYTLKTRFEIALEHYEKFEYDEAIATLTPSLKDIPKIIELDSTRLHDASYRESHFLYAMALLGNSQKHSAGDSSALKLQREAIEHIDSALRYYVEDQKEPAEREYYYKGMIYFIMRDNTEAKSNLSEITDPDSPYLQKKESLLRKIDE